MALSSLVYDIVVRDFVPPEEQGISAAFGLPTVVYEDEARTYREYRHRRKMRKREYLPASDPRMCAAYA